MLMNEIGTQLLYNPAENFFITSAFADDDSSAFRRNRLPLSRYRTLDRELSDLGTLSPLWFPFDGSPSKQQPATSSSTNSSRCGSADIPCSRMPSPALTFSIGSVAKKVVQGSSQMLTTTDPSSSNTSKGETRIAPDLKSDASTRQESTSSVAPASVCTVEWSGFTSEGNKALENSGKTKEASQAKKTHHPSVTRSLKDALASEGRQTPKQTAHALNCASKSENPRREENAGCKIPRDSADNAEPPPLSPRGSARNLEQTTAQTATATFPNDKTLPREPAKPTWSPYPDMTKDKRLCLVGDTRAAGDFAKDRAAQETSSACGSVTQKLELEETMEVDSATADSRPCSRAGHVVSTSCQTTKLPPVLVVDSNETATDVVDFGNHNHTGQESFSCGAVEFELEAAAVRPSRAACHCNVPKRNQACQATPECATVGTAYDKHLALENAQGGT